MPNYPFTTRRAMADSTLGIRVETGHQLAVTYQAQNAVMRAFTVYGRIAVLHLFGEVVTALTSVGSPVVKFQYAATTPVIAAADMSGNSGDIATLPRGQRITLVGTAVNTTTAITYAPGISYAPLAKQVIGASGFVGWIGTLTSTASSASGEINWVLHYLPLSTGAYAVAYVALV